MALESDTGRSVQYLILRYSWYKHPPQRNFLPHFTINISESSVIMESDLPIPYLKSSRRSHAEKLMKRLKVALIVWSVVVVMLLLYWFFVG